MPGFAFRCFLHLAANEKKSQKRKSLLNFHKFDPFDEINNFKVSSCDHREEETNNSNAAPRNEIEKEKLPVKKTRLDTQNLVKDTKAEDESEDGDSLEVLELQKEEEQSIPFSNLVVYEENRQNESWRTSLEGAINPELVGIKRVRLHPSKLSPDEITISEEWSSAAHEISEINGTVPCPAPIVVVCGPRNVGKSTFARYLVNTLLQKYEKVGYLDTDVGQPEFTPPGCLSLHILDKPNPDLSVLCLRTPERCYFYGDVSPKGDPKGYLYKVVNLYDHFRRHYYDSNNSDNCEMVKKLQIPLVVNTMGWVKGLGHDILVDTLRYMFPTHVVQIRLSALRKNLPFGFFWKTAEEIQCFTKLMYLGTAMKDHKAKSIVIQKHGREMRELRIVAYFRQCFLGSKESITTYKELAYALASYPPYQVSINDIKVVHLHCKVPDSELFYSLNGTLVGLGVESTEDTADSFDSICVGLGIVRGIDVSKGLYYILTPVPISTLQNVNVFLQGFLEIPTSLLKSDGFVYPYLSATTISKRATGSYTVRPSRKWNRRKLRGTDRAI